MLSDAIAETGETIKCYNISIVDTKFEIDDPSTYYVCESYNCNYKSILSIEGNFSFRYSRTNSIDCKFGLYFTTNPSTATEKWISLATFDTSSGSISEENYANPYSAAGGDGFAIGIYKSKTSSSDYTIRQLNMDLNIYYF